MKIGLMMIIVAVLAGITGAQQVSKQERPTLLRQGTVHGEIMIKEVSGNHLGNFSCGNLTVNVTKLSNDGWQRKAIATGSFAGRRCSFRVANVPAGESFVATLTAQFPNACDEKRFETTTSFPMELKSREQLRYDFTVAKIRCVLIK